MIQANVRPTRENVFTDGFCLQVIEHIISRMSSVRVETLDRLFQVAIILGKATEDVFKLTGKNMVRQIQLIWVVSLFDCRYEKS